MLCFAASQEEVPEEVGQLRGAFVNLCRVVGAPVVRIRAALPEELLAGDLGAHGQRVLYYG